MRIVCKDADEKIEAIIHAINKDRVSWEGWKCLHVGNVGSDLLQLSSLATALARRLMDQYLQNKNGSIYVSHHGYIFIFCKDVSNGVLETIGQQIQDRIMRETGQNYSFSIYDLFLEHADFIRTYPCRPEYVESAEKDDVIISNDKKVLLVEDDPVTRWLVRTALKDKCTLYTAHNSEKALASMQSHKPDIVFLDINLPGRSGLSIMRDIAKCNINTSVVMFSSHDTVENIVDTMDMGACGFMPKPFQKDKMLYYITKY